MKFAVMACFCSLTVVLADLAVAADAFYAGTWKITGAMVAPWADSQRKPDNTQEARLLGKMVAFKATQISGPPPFTCAKPQYKVTDYGPDMIFQGAFDEMQQSKKEADPKALAASLGFSGPKIKTLETGCAIDFHFVDDATAEVGLNNNVYTLKKQ